MAKKNAAKKTVKPVSKKPVKRGMKRAIKKGDVYRCGVCGVVVSVDKICGCVDTCDLICCSKPMKLKKRG